MSNTSLRASMLLTTRVADEEGEDLRRLRPEVENEYEMSVSMAH